MGKVCILLKGRGLSKNDLINTGKNKCILYGQLYTIYQEIISKVKSKTNVNNGVLSKKGDVFIPGSTTTTGIDLANATVLFEDNVLLGGDINILRIKDPDIYDPSFLAFYLTHIKKHEIASHTQGITIVHLYGRNLKKIGLELPSVEKQREIAHLLIYSKKEINFYNSIIDKYKEQKKSLIQKLLSGKWRVNLNGGTQ